MKRYIKSSVCVVDGRADHDRRLPFDKISQPRYDGVKRLYNASIGDTRLKEFSFRPFGFYHIGADTLQEVFDAIDELGIPNYAHNTRFQNAAKAKDAATKNITDREVELYWDGMGTKITRGEYSINNMTEYTSL